MHIRSVLRTAKRILRGPQETLIEVGISKENLLKNLHTYQESYPELRFAPVLKSNAYGHGLCVVAEILDKEDIAFFMVDSVYEAKRLRRHGIKHKIVVMGYARPKAIANAALRDVEYAIVDFAQLTELAALATEPTNLHLKIDTGMHRQGLLPHELPEAIALIKRTPFLRISGVCSHFADADNEDDTVTKEQIRRWKEARTVVDAAFPDLPFSHTAATKGIPHHKDLATNVARLGIGLYGFDTSPRHSLTLFPVLELRTYVSSVREIPSGEFVGYNATYRAKGTRRIATIPTGYFEGVDRRLSNKGSVLIAGKAAPIIGRVSMNMTSVDVTDIEEAKPGMPVTVISRDPEAPNSVRAIAGLMSTDEYRESEYVVLAHIPEHLRRVVE